MGCVQPFVICKCPPSVAFDELSIKPKTRTPLDKFGFPQKCCWCCSLRVATIFICIVSFVVMFIVPILNDPISTPPYNVVCWASYEINSADKALVILFPERGAVFFYCKIMYLLISLCFILACGGLFLGIIIKRHEPIDVFIWYGFIFNCLTLLFIVGGKLVAILNTGDIDKKQTIRTVFGVIWCSIFFYLLMVVNSYKLILW